MESHNIYELYEDMPIDALTDDVFKREKIVDTIYQTIQAKTATQHSCFTIGLYGKWGEGKTSVLNLIQEKLKSDYNKKIVISTFNPWFFKDQESILFDFFNSLDGGDISQKFVECLKKYAPIVSMGISGVINILAPGIGSFFRKRTLSFLDRLPDLKKSIIDRKKELDKAILESGKHLIIFIDDVDRLDSEETHILFKLIKQTANFSNTIFIIAMDKDAVANSLCCKFGNKDIQEGYNFIEKIVQMQLYLPQINEQQLFELLKKKIQTILSALPKTDIVDIQEYNEALEKMQQYVLPLLETPRQVIQYSNILSYSLLILHKDVNISDLYLLEALKVIYPHGYNIMRNSRHIILSDNHTIAYMVNMMSHQESEQNNLRQKEKQDFKDKVLSKCPEHKLFHMEELINELLYDYLNESSYRHQDISSRKRLCSKQHYNSYFMYGIPEGIISEELIFELTNQIKKLTYRELCVIFDEYIDDYGANELSRCVLQIISMHYYNNITNEAICKTCIALSLLKENMTRKYYTEFDGTKQWEFTITHILNSYVSKMIDGKPIKDFEAIIKTIEAISENTSSLFGLFFIVEFRRKSYGGYNYNPMIDKLTYEKLKKYIQEYSEEQLFSLGQVCIDELFKCWNNYESDEYQEFISRNITQPKFDIVKLINSLIYNQDSKYYEPFVALFDRKIVYNRLCLEIKYNPNLRLKEKNVNLFMSLYESELSKQKKEKN